MLPILLLSAILLAPASRAPGVATPAAVRLQPLAVTLSGASATPAAITFSATDPTGTPVVNGSSAASVNWTTNGSVFGAWTLKVSAPAAFASCATVPASAVTVSCGSVTGGFGGACGAATSLSTTPTQIASGNEGFNTVSYSVNLSFTLADSWKYIASSSCSLSVTYTITAN